MRLSLVTLVSSLAVASAGPLAHEQDRPAMESPVRLRLALGRLRAGRHGWTFVTGTSVVPSVYNQGNAGAATWVGIDGENCGNAIIQTGFTNWGDGAVETWYEWWPKPSYTYSGVSARAGDTIRMSVWAYGTRNGKVLLENLTSGQYDYRTFSNMNAQLCLTDAEWIVEQFTDTSSGNHVYLADFGTIDITSTQAKGNRGTVGADGGNNVEIYDGNEQMTSCGTNQYGVECRHIG